MVSVATDPKSHERKVHLRRYWLHGEDDDFQDKVARGLCKPIPPSEPAWKHTKAGIALNLSDLKEFMEADICGLLINTIVKKDVKKWVQQVVTYITKERFQLIPQLIEDFKVLSKKDHEPCLKTTLADFLIENPDVDTVKLAKEMPVIISLLQIHQEVGLGPM